MSKNSLVSLAYYPSKEKGTVPVHKLVVFIGITRSDNNN